MNLPNLTTMRVEFPSQKLRFPHRRTPVSRTPPFKHSSTRPVYRNSQSKSAHHLRPVTCALRLMTKPLTREVSPNGAGLVAPHLGHRVHGQAVLMPQAVCLELRLRQPRPRPGRRRCCIDSCEHRAWNMELQRFDLVYVCMYAGSCGLVSPKAQGYIVDEVELTD